MIGNILCWRRGSDGRYWIFRIGNARGKLEEWGASMRKSRRRTRPHANVVIPFIRFTILMTGKSTKGGSRGDLVEMRRQTTIHLPVMATKKETFPRVITHETTTGPQQILLKHDSHSGNELPRTLLTMETAEETRAVARTFIY